MEVDSGEVAQEGSSLVEQSSPSRVLIRVQDLDSHEEAHFDSVSLTGFGRIQEALLSWTPGKELPEFDVVMPELSSASAGLQLLKSRLSESRDRTGKVVAWSCPRWWRATQGETTALMSALYIFDVLWAKTYLDEVAETINTFRVHCYEPYRTIVTSALPLEVVSHQETQLPSFKVDKETLESLFCTALRGNEKAKALADRAIAAWPLEDLVPMLWKVFSSLDWDSPDGIEAQNWVFFHVELVGARSRKAALKLLRCIIHDVQASYNTGWGSLDRIASPAFYAGDALLHGILLDACRRKELAESDKEALKDYLLNVTDQLEKLNGSFPQSVTILAHCGWTMDLFEVAPLFVQVAILEALLACYIENSERSSPLLLDGFLGRVSMVAPEARHLLLRMAKFLSVEDLDFLHDASFPGLAP